MDLQGLFGKCSMGEVLTRSIFCAHHSCGGSHQPTTVVVTDHAFISIHKNDWTPNCNVGPLMFGEFRQETFTALRTIILIFSP